MTLHNLRLETTRKNRSERAFALLLVLLILAGMLTIGVPFAVSMRLSSRRSQTALADAHARFAAEGAYNHAIACLMRTQEQYDPWPRTRVRPADSTLFESHTLDIPAELAVTFDDARHPELDLTGEIETRNPRGVIWSVEVEDEQGKVNLNSASEHLLENLLYLLGPDVDVDPADDDDAIKGKRVTAAKNAALALIGYRRANAGFHTVSEAESVLRDTGLFEAGQLSNFSSYASVSSARPNPGAPHPININTAPELVLVANLMNLRLRTLQAKACDDNKGNGAPSPVRIDDNTAEGDWKVELTAPDSAEVYFRGAREGAAWELKGTTPVTEQPVELTVYGGTIPFDPGDVFYFSTRRITEELARDLAGAIRAEVKLTAGAAMDLGGGITGQIFRPADKDLLGEGGHAAVGTDVMSYMLSAAEPTDDYLFVNPDKEYEEGREYKARRIIANVDGLGSLTEIIREWECIPADCTEDEVNSIANGLKSAVKLNAFRPLSPELDSPTAPFCFTTCDVYTITGRGSVSDNAGNELAARGVRKIVSVRRPIPIAQDDGTRREGVWTIDTESAFDQLITGTSTSGIRASRSMPDMSDVHDTRILSIPFNYRFEAAGRVVLPRVELASRRLWDMAAYPSMILHFGSDVSVLSHAVGGTVAPLRGTPYGAGADGLRLQKTSAAGTAEDGIFFNRGSDFSFKDWPRLAYATEHAPILPATSRSPTPSITCIEMWFRPDDWSDEERDYFLFDTSAPYHNVAVEDWDSAHVMPRTLDLQATPQENRIALYYSGATRQLIFRISDATLASQSGEIRCRFDSETGTWHHVKAIWSGMDYGEMALLIDGEAPDGTDADEGGTGRYHPMIRWRDMRKLRYDLVAWPAIAGNQIYEPPDCSQPARGTPGPPQDRPPADDDPVTIYGYDLPFLAMHYYSDPEDWPEAFYNNLALYGGGRLDSDLAAEARTKVKLPVDEHGRPVPIPPDAVTIPVDPTQGTQDFQEKGFLGIGDEIVYYDSKTNSSFDDVIRGVDICSGGFGPNESVGSTGVATEPREIASELDIIPISIYITENRRYPTPRYFHAANEDVGTAAGFFGIGSSPKNYVRIDNEFISYTHKPGIRFLVDLDMFTRDNYTMRGQFATEAADHTAGAHLRPVYRVGHNGGPGGPGVGDSISAVDDRLKPGRAERRIHSVAGGRRYVSFVSGLPVSCWLDKNARMLKFPSGRFYPGTFFSIGTNSGPKTDYEAGANPFKMDQQAQATIDEFKLSHGEGNISVARITLRELPASGREQLFIVRPYAWDPDFEIAGLSGSGVRAWPTHGYALIGDEIIYYRTLYRHNVRERESGVGTICAAAGGVYLRASVSAGAHSIRWSPGDQGGTDPSTARFFMGGGYLTIISYSSTTEYGEEIQWISAATRQYLIDSAAVLGLSEQQVQQLQDSAPDPETGLYALSRPGGFRGGGGSKQEVIRYEALEPAGGGDDWLFTGLQRGLMGTEATEHAPTQNEETGGMNYPCLVSNIAELQIIQRGCLGTAARRHPLGSKVVPLYHIISAFMTKPLTTTDDRLYVESYDHESYDHPRFSHANFPQRGYLLVSDGTRQEIIGYTSKGYDAVGPFFEGVRYLRRRFGTPPVDLSDLSLVDASAADYPSPENCRKGVVRLYEPRYDDRLPLDPDTGEFAYDAPAPNTESNAAYLEISRSIRGARWESIKWAEGPGAQWDDPAPGRQETGTEIFVLARIDGQPDWTQEPVHWQTHQQTLEALRAGGAGNDELEAAAKKVLLFDNPAEENTIRREGDTLELRIYFKYNSNYAVQATGQIEQWVSPILRGLKVGYSAPSSVYQQEEVRF